MEAPHTQQVAQAVDPLRRLWQQPQYYQTLLVVACTVCTLVYALSGLVSVGVYALALLPGVLLCRWAVRRWGDEHAGGVDEHGLPLPPPPDGAEAGGELRVVQHRATPETLCRTAVAGIVFTGLICVYERTLQLLLNLIEAAMIGGGGDDATVATFAALFQAYIVAAAVEEAVKLRLTQRALQFEPDAAASAKRLLLHSVFGSAAFATLENVLYLNLRSKDSPADGVDVTSIVLRTLLCVPMHVAWGVCNACGLAMHHFGAGGGPVLPWVVLVSALGPSLALHGTWDFFIFLASNFQELLLNRCDSVEQDSRWNGEESWLASCVRRDGRARGLHKSLLTVEIMGLVSFFVIPLATLLVCRRRLRRLRELEEGGGAAAHQQGGGGFDEGLDDGYGGGGLNPFMGYVQVPAQPPANPAPAGAAAQGQQDLEAGPAASPPAVL
jgi:PrsW family intramembrane metalloprotease